MKDITFEDDDGFEITLKTRYEVCENCRGKGTTVNPAIDGHGLTAQDFHEDPDFYEEYMSGVYDVPCFACKGLRVVPVVDEDKNSQEDIDKYCKHLDELYQMNAEYEAERRFGA